MHLDITKSKALRVTTGGSVKFPSNTKACGLLEKLAQETGSKNEREITVSKSQQAKLAKVDDAFEKFLKGCERRIWKNDSTKDDETANYRDAAERLGGMGLTPRDVEIWSLLAPEILEKADYLRPSARHNVDMWTGIFLSAAVNAGKGARFVIHTGNFARPPVMLGFANLKNIVVKGPVGEWCGLDMTGGSITVEGSAEDHCGEYLKGGRIIVKGDAGKNAGSRMEKGSVTIAGSAGDEAGDEIEGGKLLIGGSAGSCCGSRMSGGLIEVTGDAGEHCGSLMEKGTIRIGGSTGKSCADSMSGGTIRVEGEIVELGEPRDGRVYHKGKLVWSLARSWR